MILSSRDHNATSYSTETKNNMFLTLTYDAEIITLRAIALKLSSSICVINFELQQRS